MAITVLCSLLAAAGTFAITYFLGRKRLQELSDRIGRLEIEKILLIKDAEAATRTATESVETEKAKQAGILAAKDEQIQSLNSFISQAREALSNEFKALANESLAQTSSQLIGTADLLIRKHGEQTTGDVQLHQQQIENILKPVEESIKRLDQHVANSESARIQAQALLNEQVLRLSTASESLSSALRKPVVRGSWGEMTLENALENAGLQAEIDFVLQHSTDAEDGKKRTDALVNLPKGRKLIIDSKNLMDTYIALINCNDATQKGALAETHSKSLKSHLKDLSSKEYWKRYDGLDCVILFIPHDGMYHAAITDEAELIRDACEKRVFVTNPMSLIPLLKAVRYVLDQDRLNKSAYEISKVGLELYQELARFAEKMSAIGLKLRLTVGAYNDAIPSLDRFLVAKSRKLKQLGSAKGADPELPQTIDLHPRLFSSPELQPSNTYSLTANAEGPETEPNNDRRTDA